MRVSSEGENKLGATNTLPATHNKINRRDFELFVPRRNGKITLFSGGELSKKARQ